MPTPLPVLARPQDPLNVQHQLLVVFLCSYAMDTAAAAALYMRGWRCDHIVYQGHTFIYWHRHNAGVQHAAAPLVFLHGIGVGCVPHRHCTMRSLLASPRETY
jgi:hypothetical protein